MSNGLIGFIYTITVFGTLVDVTLAGLAIESFCPADPTTADALRSLAVDAPPHRANGR